MKRGWPINGAYQGGAGEIGAVCRVRPIRAPRLPVCGFVND